MTRQHVSGRRDMFIANRLPVGADLKLKFVALWHVPVLYSKTEISCPVARTA